LNTLQKAIPATIIAARHRTAKILGGTIPVTSKIVKTTKTKAKQTAIPTMRFGSM
jgi:hypothetical protein